MIILKRISLRSVVVFAALITLSKLAQAQTDKIEGQWYNDEKTAKIQIYKAGNGKFFGKIIWLKEPLKDGKPKVDEKNPDTNMRRRPVLGLQILSGFVKDGDDKYVDGTIYDPKNGKTYSCKMSYKGKTLDIRGYIGISLIGRTTVWTRAE